MKTKHQMLVVACTAASLLVPYALRVAAQSGKPKSGPIPMAPKLGPWWEEKWTGDNTPYRHLRQQIDRQVARGQKPGPLASKYATLYYKRKDRSDLLSLFG